MTIVTVSSDYSGNLMDYNSNHNLPAPTPPVLAQSEAALFSRDASGKGLWYVQPTAPSNVPTWFTSGTALGAATDIPMQGDFDGDGKVDLATYNPTTAIWTFTDSTRGLSSFPFGTPKTSVPVVGNFDGPGVTEFGVFDIVNGVGQWTISTSTGGLRVGSVRSSLAISRSLATTMASAKTSWPSTGPARGSSWSTRVPATHDR